MVHLSLAFCLKTLGNYTWTALYDPEASQYLCDVTNATNDVIQSVGEEVSLKEMIASGWKMIIKIFIKIVKFTLFI